MPYIAHSAVILHDNYSCYQKNVWQTVYDQDGLEIRWRISDGKNMKPQLVCLQTSGLLCARQKTFMLR